MGKADNYSLLLLAGGKSSRMGTNKAELLYEGRTFIENLIEKAKKLGIGKISLSGYEKDGENLQVVYDIYPEVNVVVHPSHSENLGGAAESLMLAVPTISSDVGGFPDIVIPGETGCLVKSKNPEDLADKIIWAVEHQDEMKGMAKKGQVLVNELLDLNNTAAKIHEVYSKILNS